MHAFSFSNRLQASSTPLGSLQAAKRNFRGGFGVKQKQTNGFCAGQNGNGWAPSRTTISKVELQTFQPVERSKNADGSASLELDQIQRTTSNKRTLVKDIDGFRVGIVHSVRVFVGYGTDGTSPSLLMHVLLREESKAMLNGSPPSPMPTADVS